MTNPSFSMVTVQSEDSGITWETSSSRCSTPWTSETSTTSDLYSMESSPVGSPPGKVIFIMDEGKIVRKRKRKPSDRMPLPTHVRGGQGNKKRDSSGMQRQEPRTVLGDVQDSMLNVEQMEAHDTDEEMLEDKEDLENIAEKPVKRAPIRSVFRESRLKKVGPILGGPVKSRIQLFNSIFGGTGPLPETLEKSRIQRKSSVSGESECFLEASVKERSHKFISETTHKKSFQRTSRSLETPTERRRNQRQQSTAHSKQSYSSVTPLEKQFTSKDVSFQNIKPVKTKDKPSKYSKTGEEITFQHKERKVRQSRLENLNQESKQTQKFCPPEEARKQQSYSYSPAANRAITEQLSSTARESGDKSEEQLSLPSNETANKKPEQSPLTASDFLDEPKQREIQPSSTLLSVSADSVNKLDRQSTQSAVSTMEHLEKEVQKSAVQSYLPTAPLATPSYVTPSETRQEDIIPQSSETAQSESEHGFLPHSLDVIEKQETEYHSSATAQSETEHSGLSYSVKKKESQRTPLPEMQNIYLEKKTESEQELFFAQEVEQQVIKLNSHTPENMDSKYFGISYPVCTETQEAQKRPVVNKAVDLDHPVFSVDKNNQAESTQMETEYPDFSYSSEESGESVRPQTETEHADFFLSKEVTEELESAQLKTEDPHSSYSREETDESKISQGETEQPDFSFSREKVEESESTQPETECREFLFSEKDTEKSESPHQETEYPDFSYSREEVTESERTQLEMEQPDFSFSREEIEYSESAQPKIEHPDFSYSREEMVKSEDAHVKLEQPDFSFPREETKDLESTPRETKHPEFDFSKEDKQESESTQMETEHSDFSYFGEEMLETESAQLEQTDFSFPGEETEESESAQLETEHQDFSFSRDETEGQKSIPFELEQPKSYSPEEAEQEKTAQLELEPSDISCLMEKAEKENTTKLELVHPDTYDLSGRDRMQQMEHKETRHSDLPSPQDETKHQDLAQVDTDKPLLSYFGDRGEQAQPVQKDLQPGDKLYSLGKSVQGETDQLHLECPVLPYSATKEQQHKEESDKSYSTGKTDQEIFQPKVEHADFPYFRGEAAQEAVQKDVGSPEWSCFLSEAQQSEIIQLASENRDLSFTTGEIVQEEMKSGSLNFSHSIDGQMHREMVQLEQEHLLPTYSTPDSQQEETTPLDLPQPDISYCTGKIEQENRVQRGLEELVEIQPKATQEELDYSDLPENWGKVETQDTDQMNLAHQETTEPELEHPPVPCPFRELMQEEKKIEPAYPEQTFYASIDMQEEVMQQKTKQPFISCFNRKSEQDEIMHPEQEQTSVPFSSGKEAPLEMETGSEYPDLSYSSHRTEQEKFRHPTLPFSLKEQETPSVIEHPDLSCNTSELKPGDTIQESEYPEKSYSMEEMQQESEYLDSADTLARAPDETVEVESEYPNVSCSDGKKSQQETSQLVSKYPDTLFSFRNFKEQATQEFDSKHKDFPRVARKGDLPGTVQIDSKYPDLTYSSGKTEEPEIAQSEARRSDLSYSTSETNKQEAALWDQKHRKNSLDREKQQQTPEEQVEQEKFSYSSSKTEQLKYAEDCFEKKALSFSTVRPEEKMALTETEHADVIYPLEKAKVQQREQLESEQMDLTYTFEKAEQKITQPEVEKSNLAHSVGTAELEEIAELEQRYPDLPYSVFQVEKLQSEELKPEHPGLACSFNELQETTQLNVMDAHGKTEICPLAKLELGNEYLASPADKVGQQEMMHTLECPNENQSASRAEHPQPTKEKPGVPDTLSCSGKEEQRGMAKPALKHPELSYSIHGTQPQKNTQLELGKPDLATWSGKTEQEQYAQKEQSGFLCSFNKEEAQPEMGRSQLSYSVSEIEQEIAHEESIHSSLSAGRLEQHEFIQPEAEIMDLSCSVAETQQSQIDELDLEYSDLSHSTGALQKQEEVQPELEEPSDFSSCLRKEQKENVGMQAEPSKFQCSDWKTERLQDSQVESECTDLSFSVSTAEAHETTKSELKELDLLHSFVKTKQSWDSPEPDHLNVSNVMAKVPHPDLFSSTSEEKQSAQVDFKQERESYALHAEEMAKLKLEQPTLSSAHGTVEQPRSTSMERKFLESLYFSGEKRENEKEKQDTLSQELEHSGLLDSTDKTQQQETTQPESGQLDLSSYSGKKEQPQTVQVEGVHQEMLRFPGETQWQGTAQSEIEHPDLSYAIGKVEQPQVTQWKSEQSVTPPHIGTTHQQRMAHSVQDLGKQEFIYGSGKTDEMQTVQGELEHTASLYFSDKTEQEMVISELQHPRLSYSVKAMEEKTAHQKSDNKDSSYSTCHQEHHKIVQPEMEEMDLSYRTGISQHSQSAQIVLQKPGFLKSFEKLEEKGLAQLSFLHSLGEEKQKPSSQLDLTQPCLSHLLDKAEKQETAQQVFMSSDFSYSMGKEDQLQTEQVKYPCVSYSLDKAETHRAKPLGLLSSYGKAEQTQTAHLEHPETSYFAGETEQRNGTHPELQCFNLPPSAAEAEQKETLSVSDTSARTEEQQTAELKSEQSDLLNSTEKAEKHKIAVLRAGHSEKRNTGIISSQTTPLETEQDLSFSTKEATSQKTQSCSSLPEKSVSVPLGVSYSERKMERNPKYSPVPEGLSSERLDLSCSQCKTEPSETAQPVSGFFTRKEAENTRIHLHLPMAAPSEAEHVILPETEREQTPQYFHTTPQLESEQLNTSCCIDKTETLESQEYLSASSKLGTESSAPFYSVDGTHQQEIPPYSKPASENLVAKYSLAEQEKQSMQLVIPQSAQSECKYVIPPHEEVELQKNQLHSPKPASLKTEQFENKTVLHTKERDEQDLTGHLSLEQLSSPKLSAKWDKQEVQPDVQKVPQLVNVESKATPVADQQSVSSDTFVPFHALSKKTVSVAFTDDEEKQNIPSSLPNVVGIPENQTNILSHSFTKEEDRHEMQPYFTGQKHSSLEQLRSVSSDLVYDTVAHKTQHYSCEQGTLYSMESKSIFPSSNEMQNPDIPSPGLASWLAEEVKAHSVNPIKAKRVDKLSPNGASDFGSKQFPAGNFTEVTIHDTTDNKGNAFRVSDSEIKISYGLSSETGHRTGRHDLPSPGADNPGPDKGPKSETRFGNPTKRKAAPHLEADKMSNVPEDYLRREEEEMKHMSTAEDSQHAPEQKDLFNIISEGYEILNIHAPAHISSIDQEESKHMPDKLEYLETNPSFKKKITHERQEASASGTTEISGISMLGMSESHKVKELVKTDDVGETEEIQEENPVMSENRNHAVLDTDNGISEIDYFEKYTLIDDKSPIKPHFERPSSSCPVKEDLNEPVEQATSSKETAEEDTLEEEFALLEDLDEVFYGTVKGESKMQSYVGTPERFPLQKSIDISSKKATSVEDEQKSPGTPLFDSEEGVLERSLLFPTTVAAVNPELLEEPPALSFLYKDLYAEAVGEKTKDETPSDEESGNSNASFPSRNSDTDDGTGIYFEKYILKDEIPGKVFEPQKDQIQEDESFSGGISVPSSEEKYKQRSADVLSVRTEILPESDIVEKVHSDIKATICKPTHAIPFGGRVIVSGARSDVTEERQENVPVETTEELPEQTSQQEYSQIVDSLGAAHQEFINKQEEHHEITAIPQVERYVPYTRTPVEDSEDDQYAQEILSHVPTIQQREKPDFQRKEQHPRVYEDFAESMDYDVITQEELLQDEISSEFTHEELLFEDRDSFEHIGDNYEFFNEPEQRTPVELEDSGFVVMYPEKSAANIPEIESPQRELKKAQTDTYCCHCKCPISAIDKLFGEHKDHEVTTLDDAATKMKDQLGELLIALEKKSMKIEEFVSDIESLFNSVEENCKKNAELLEKQNEEMLKKMVAQYDEKSENFEEVKKMKMEYLYEQMVNFQQTVDSAKETLETTVKEMEELNGFVFLNVMFCNGCHSFLRKGAQYIFTV
uniref:Cardiomyopathy associated 5 n=1 Tax=Meleagris gallopavo TaxID=9103 RepID=A0A803XWC0_MELGA